MTNYIFFMLIGICVTLIAFTCITSSLSKKRKILLTFIAVFSIILLSMVMVASLYNGSATDTGLRIAKICKFLNFMMYPMVLGTFNQYLKDLLSYEGGVETTPKALWAADFAVMVEAMMIIISQFTGLYYTYDATNTYVRGRWYGLSFIAPVFVLVFQLIAVISIRDKMSKKLRLPIILFLAAPIIASVFQLKTHIPITIISIIVMTAALYCFSILETNKMLASAHKQEIELLKEHQKKVNEVIMQTTLALAEAIEAKDSYTNGHSKRVAEYSKMIAERVGKNEEECESIYITALLHDIGKIGIPEKIINKRGKLTPEEYEVIKSHPLIGRSILSKITANPELVVGASFHHERFDGKGYPFGLFGHEIPETARIIAVADTYDAMNSERSYRGRLSMKKIKQELKDGAGTQFDPDFANIMVDMIESNVLS